MLPDDRLLLGGRYGVLASEVGHRLLEIGEPLLVPQAEGPDGGVDPHRIEDVVEDVALGAGLVFPTVEPRPEVAAVPVPVGLSGEVVEVDGAALCGGSDHLLDRPPDVGHPQGEGGDDDVVRGFEIVGDGDLLPPLLDYVDVIDPLLGHLLLEDQDHPLGGLDGGDVFDPLSEGDGEGSGAGPDVQDPGVGGDLRSRDRLLDAVAVLF